MWQQNGGPAGPGPGFNPMMTPGVNNWQQQPQQLQQWHQQQQWLQQQQQQQQWMQQQQYPGMWQQYPPVPGYPQPPLPRQGLAPPPPPGAPAHPPLPGARPPVPGQPPLPGAKPPAAPSIPVSGNPPPPPPPDQPPPPPGSDTTSAIAPTPPMPQPPAPSSASVPVAKPNNNNSNASKLNLSAPPPPPPPEEDKQTKPPPLFGRGGHRNNVNKSQSKAVIRGSGRGSWRGSDGNGRMFQNNPYQDDTEYDDNYCNQEYDNGYNDDDYDQGYGNMDLENDDNAQNNDNNEYDEYDDQNQNQYNDWRGNFGRSYQERFNNKSSTFSNIRPGDWKCGDEACREINFARREECRKCKKSRHFQKLKSENNERKSDKNDVALSKFDKMFKNWEATYEKWKDENKDNPDDEYTQSYSAQMEAMKSQLLDKRKKLINSKVMVEKWHSESGTVDVHNPFTSPKKLVEADKDDKSDAFSSLAAANECVMKLLEDNDYSEDSDEDKNEEKNNVKRSRWADPEPEIKNKKSRWGDANDDLAEQSQQESRWNEESEFPSKKSRWGSNDDADDLNINDMRRRPTNSNFQPRPGVFQPRMNSFQGRPFLNQNNPNMNKNQPFGRGGLLGGPPRGFNPRGFGSFRGRGGQFQRPPVQDNFENFWNPSEVKDYSQKQSSNFNNEPDFRPQTFDYSHGIKSGNIGNNGHHRGRGGPFSSPARDLGVKMSGRSVMVDSILSRDADVTRPPKIVVILRGVPGSGKSHVAKLIKDKEVEFGREQPRTMCLDDYFEVDGEYDYEAEMEESYRNCLLKSFKKNIDAGLFKFLIIDAVNNKSCHFKEFWSYAKQHGYEVYVCTVECDPVFAASRNTHKRTEEEVSKLAKTWEETPGHMNTLDIRSLLQDDAIEHVEMSEAADETVVKEPDDKSEEKSDLSQNDEEEDTEGQSFLRASKWEILDKEEKLARLDGTGDKMKSRMSQHDSIEDWLELNEDKKPMRQGQKRVRWADIEQRKAQARVAQFGFVVGQTNWASREDKEAAASSALTATKIIPNRFHSEFHQ